MQFTVIQWEKNCLYMGLTSVVRAMRCRQKRSSMSTRDECTVGPTRSWSFNETPDEDFIEASKTALTFVVVLDSLTTACMGR